MVLKKLTDIFVHKMISGLHMWLRFHASATSHHADMIESVIERGATLAASGTPAALAVNEFSRETAQVSSHRVQAAASTTLAHLEDHVD